MRLFIFLFAVLALCAAPVHAQEVAPSATAPRFNETKIELTDATLADYFLAYVAAGDIKKSDFETDEAFKARRPGNFPADKTITIVVNQPKAVDPDPPSPFKRPPIFDYDIKKQTLTMYNRTTDRFILRWDSSDEFEIKWTLTDNGSYDSTNAYGAKATVRKADKNIFFLRVKNMKQAGAVIDQRNRRFKITTKLPPAKAEQASKNCEVVLVVHPVGLTASKKEFLDISRPTVRNPVDGKTFGYVIDATIVQVTLRDKETKSVIASYDVK